MKNHVSYLKRVQVSPNDFEFTGDRTLSNVNHALKSHEACRRLWGANKVRCNNTMDAGDLDELCESCSAPISCSLPEMRSRLQELVEDIQVNLDDVVTYPASDCGGGACAKPAQATLLQGTSRGFNRETKLCTWSGMRGMMAGGGEVVRILPVEYSTGDNEWDAAVGSGRTDPSQKLTGYFHCTDKSNFFGASEVTDDNPAANEKFQEIVATGTWPVSQWRETEALTSMAGIKGNMEGGGEYGEYIRPRHEVRARTGKSYLKAWFSSLGRPNGKDLAPNLSTFGNLGDTYVEIDTSSGPKTAKLVHWTEGHCYLEYVGGDFDGRGERVQLRVHSDNMWHLEVSAGCRDWSGWFGWGDTCQAWRYVRARARCIAYNQN